MASLFEKVFLLYFFSHIPITIFIDSQIVFPKWIYPTFVSRYFVITFHIDSSIQVFKYTNIYTYMYIIYMSSKYGTSTTASTMHAGQGFLKKA